jgi:hypothetical protein
VRSRLARLDAAFQSEAKRLEIDIPPQPLTNSQFVLLWAKIGKVLLPFEQPEPGTLHQLWAEIGMFLAEEKEPEFQWGPGRRPGSKSSFPQPKVVTPAAIRQRRSRAKRRLVSLIKRDGN